MELKEVRNEVGRLIDALNDMGVPDKPRRFRVRPNDQLFAFNTEIEGRLNMIWGNLNRQVEAQEGQTQT